MPAHLYLPIYILVIAAMCYIVAARYYSSPGFVYQIRNSSVLIPFMICILLTLWLGGRPISGMFFGDTSSYAHTYEEGFIGNGSIDLRSEWFWTTLTLICKNLGFSVHLYFIVVEAIYIFSVLWAIKHFVPSNPMLGMLFVFSSLMFFTFGTNGIRNGMACHLTALAISYFLMKRYGIAGLLMFIAFGTHRSVFLPIVSIIAAKYFIKNFKTSMYIWVACIFISLLVGGTISNMFASLDFDDRMSQYLTNRNNDSFSSTGFRWDFLIYSAPPILLGWYVIVKRQIKDEWFRILCMAYCFANAFWVLVIRVAFSNRFAYLSWFLYPIIVAYAVINLPIWEDQDKKTGMILTVYCTFTVFMNLFYWSS